MGDIDPGNLPTAGEDKSSSSWMLDVDLSAAARFAERVRARVALASRCHPTCGPGPKERPAPSPHATVAEPMSARAGSLGAISSRLCVVVDRVWGALVGSWL